MTTQRARRAVATALLSAGALLLLPAAAHADTCMVDDKGNQVCGASGSGPASGPGSYTGFNGVHDGTPGAPGPDGQPLAAATPPPWMAPGWTPPPLPTSAQPAPNGPGLSTVKLAPGQLPPGVSGSGAAPAAPQSSQELPPPGPAAPAQGSAAGAGANPAASSSPTASAAPSSAPASATPAPTMTEMAQHSPPPTAAPAAPVRAQAARTSEESSFDPGVLLAALGGLAIAGAVAWFVPGIRSAITGLLRRGH